MIDQLIQLAAAGIGSLGFALLFNLRGRRLFWASLGGVISWGVYLVVMAFWPHEAGSYLLAALLLTVYAEIMARIQKAPVTVYLVAGTIPLIPGASLYDMMLCGHEHRMHMFDRNDADLRFDASFPVAVGSAVFIGKNKCPYPEFEGASFICTGFTIDNGNIVIHATDDNGHMARIY